MICISNVIEPMVTLNSINLWYGFGAQAYISILFCRATIRNRILSYLTIKINFISIILN